MRCRLFAISPMQLLADAQFTAPEVFFQEWSSMPSGWQAVGSATQTGVAGGLAVLSALERSQLLRVALHALPAQGGFMAAYSGEGTSDRSLPGSVKPWQDCLWSLNSTVQSN